jgi:hypothetical protein
MNYETDTLYIVIKNDQVLLERIFQGLFTVARRALGYSPRSSSYPFITAERWEGHKGFSQEKASYDKQDAIQLCLEDYPRKNTNKRDNSQYHMFVTMYNTSETNKNGIISKAIAGSGDIDLSLVNTNTLAKNLFDDYFKDMVAFARTSATYQRNWQQIAISEAA